MRVEGGQQPADDEIVAEISPEVHAAVMADRKVEAVKLLMDESGLGLRDAKRIVDLIAQRHGGAGVPDSPGFTEVGGTRGLIIVIAAIVVAYAAWRFLMGS